MKILFWVIIIWICVANYIFSYNCEVEDLKLEIRMNDKIDSLAKMHDMTVEVVGNNYNKNNNIVAQIKELLIYFAGIYTMVHGGTKGSKKLIEKIKNGKNLSSS